MAILNNSPVLKLSEIIAQLFNNELLADVTFSCGDQVIHAHSFLLMSRSVVYQEEFHGNQGIQKLIPINYDYKSFYEYVRFIYTDYCTVTKDNSMALLELSVKYKIPKLENMVIAYIISNETALNFDDQFKIYEFCETQNYPLLRNWVSKFIGPEIPKIIKSDDFITTQPDLLELILKMDFMGTTAEPVKEVDLFNALIKWMNHYCGKYGIALSERRTKFDNLIKLIRFPTMVFAELTDCIQKSDNLFTDSDYVTFFKSAPGMFNCTTRQICPPANAIQFEQNVTSIAQKQTPINRNYSHYEILYPFGLYETPIDHNNYYYQQPAVKVDPPKQTQKFETTDKLIISGLRIISQGATSFEMRKSTQPNNLINMTVTPSASYEIIVSLGESFEMQPGVQYEIDVPVSNAYKMTGDLKVDLVQPPFKQYYRELGRDPRVVEIFFKTS